MLSALPGRANGEGTLVRSRIHAIPGAVCEPERHRARTRPQRHRASHGRPTTWHTRQQSRSAHRPRSFRTRDHTNHRIVLSSAERYRTQSRRHAEGWLVEHLDPFCLRLSSDQLANDSSDTWVILRFYPEGLTTVTCFDAGTTDFPNRHPPNYYNPFALATSPYHWALAFGVRAKVSRSQPISPKVGVNPLAHS